MKPLFYKWYVDDIHGCHKKNCADQLHYELNDYHPNINVAIDINPKKFVEIVIRNFENDKLEIVEDDYIIP